MPRPPQRGQNAGMHRVLRVVLPLIAAAIGLFFTVVLWIWHRFEECNADDSNATTTAPKSAQGKLCGVYQSGTSDYATPIFLAAIVVGIVVMVLLWQRAGRVARVSALLVPVLTPWLTVVLLSLPSDECSAEDAQRDPRGCRTDPY